MAKMTLRAARTNVKMQQKKAATALGISNKTLSKWENGLSMPKADKIDLICALYKVTYDDLIFLPSDSLKAD